jgi:uncharacterized protein
MNPLNLASPITIDIICARNFAQRAIGLLRRGPLSTRQGLLLHPCSAVHTCFMRYAIDVVFVDNCQRIVKLVATVKPWRFVICSDAFSTLELAAGQIHARGLYVGQELQFISEKQI